MRCRADNQEMPCSRGGGSDEKTSLGTTRSSLREFDSLPVHRRVVTFPYIAFTVNGLGLGFGSPQLPYLWLSENLSHKDKKLRCCSVGGDRCPSFLKIDLPGDHVWKRGIVRWPA